MKKVLIGLFAALAICSLNGVAATIDSSNAICSQKVVSRGTSKLYWSDECLTLYSNGSCVLTQGDSVRIEGTYEIKDGWLILYFGEGSVSCKATIGRDGSVQSISYNGNVYRKR